MVAFNRQLTGSSAEKDKSRVNALKRGSQAVLKLREQSQKMGISKMSEKEIESEIKKSRAKR